MKIVVISENSTLRAAFFRAAERAGRVASSEPCRDGGPCLAAVDLDLAGDALAAFSGPVLPVYLTRVESDRSPFELLKRRPGHLLCQPPADADLDRIIAAASAVRPDGAAWPLGGGPQLFEFGNRVGWINEVVDTLVRVASPHFPADREAGVRLGLVELVANAIEHGNLEIDNERKQAALRDGKPALDRLYRRQLENPAFAARRVRIECRVDARRCEWRIIDQGRGFDWREWLADASSPDLSRLSGRGLFLARLQFDAFDYEGNGTIARVALGTAGR